MNKDQLAAAVSVIGTLLIGLAVLLIWLSNNPALISWTAAAGIGCILIAVGIYCTGEDS